MVATFGSRVEQLHKFYTIPCHQTFKYNTTLTRTTNDSSIQAIAGFYVFKLATIYQLPTEVNSVSIGNMNMHSEQHLVIKIKCCVVLYRGIECIDAGASRPYWLSLPNPPRPSIKAESKKRLQ